MASLAPEPNGSQLTERRQGNAAYRAGRHAEALAHYERARAVVELVRGLSRADQAEVDVNRVAVNCNLAAVHLAAKDFGAAVAACDAALALAPGTKKAVARRARANAGRHDHAAAAADVEALRRLDPLDPEVAELEALLRRTRVVGRRADRAAFGNMFARPAAA
jgi:tetratricopeptide (TPR) repeat protein